jgi:hypothetical protein
MGLFPYIPDNTTVIELFAFVLGFCSQFIEDVAQVVMDWTLLTLLDAWEVLSSHATSNTMLIFKIPTLMLK